MKHNGKCNVSTGIHGGLTFGRGRLDDYGYWQFPCHECARRHELFYPEDGPCWPFSVCEECGRGYIDVRPRSKYDGWVLCDACYDLEESNLTEFEHEDLTWSI